MKKALLTLVTIGAMTLSFAANHKCGGGKCGAQMKQKQSKPKGKPFLIIGKLPHLSGLVKLMWDDEDLALSADQKKKLLVVRQNTMKAIQSIAPKIHALEAKIVKASNDGVKDSSLKSEVSILATLRAEATMIHLSCIYETRQILSADQLYILE